MKFLTKIEAIYDKEYDLAEKSMDEMLKKFWPDFKGPKPQLKIVDNLNMKWLGQYKYGQVTSLISIQRRIVDHKDTLDGTMTHELIHLMDWLNNRSNLSHGSYFTSEMNRINGIMGMKFVTPKSDEDDVIAPPSKEYFLFVEPNETRGFYFTHSAALSARQKAHISQHPNGKLFKVQYAEFSHSPRIGSGSKAYVTEEDKKKLLSDLFNSGKDIKFNISHVPDVFVIFGVEDNTVRFSWSKSITPSVKNGIKLLVKLMGSSDKVVIYKSNDPEIFRYTSAGSKFGTYRIPRSDSIYSKIVNNPASQRVDLSTLLGADATPEDQAA